MTMSSLGSRRAAAGSPALCSCNMTAILSVNRCGARGSDETHAGRGALAEELHAAAITAKDEAKSQSPQHLGDPRAALRAGGGLVEVGTGHWLDIELNRLVSASHQV